jgi:glycosyltransferase involved in cell wall biosynthesis
MSKQPLVSVVITTYNRTEYIERAVESALKQTYKNIEVIIVDDASTDKTPEILSKISKKDQRIIILTNEKNLDLVRTLNRGIKIAKGKYIARLDDDDFWCGTKKLEKQVNFLEMNPEYNLVGGGIIKIDKEGKETARYLSPENDKDIRKVILVNNVFVHSTVLFRRNIFEKLGGYNEQFVVGQDIELWLKMGKIGKFYNFQEFFVYYLDHEYDGSSRSYRMRRKIGLNIKLRKKYRNDYAGYKKAFLLCWASYFYSFLPFKQKLWPILFKIRTLIFGLPPYKYFKK